MARKATDLLDVFRHGGDHDDGDSRVVSSARAAKRAKAKRIAILSEADDRANTHCGGDGLMTK